MKLKMKGIKTMEILIALISAMIGGCLGFIISSILLANAKFSSDEEYRAIIHDLESQNKSYRIITEDNNKIFSEYESKIASKDKIISQNELLRKDLERELERYKELYINEKSKNKSDFESKERLPLAITNTIRGMDYRKITNKKSDQYALQKNCYSNEIGIRMYDKYYCTALGSAYGRDIGDTWHVTLECGTEFDIIYAEYKDDGTDPNFFGHPDKNNDKEDCINILEFVMDTDFVSREVMLAGTFTKLDIFGGLYGHGGNVVKMEYTGRVWSRQN